MQFPEHQNRGVESPLPTDIALGRGGMANNHEGNKAFRRIVSDYQEDYLKCKFRVDKGMVIRQILKRLQEEGFRFVEKRAGVWVETKASKIRAKVAQALREHAPEARKLMAARNAAEEDHEIPLPFDHDFDLDMEDGAFLDLLGFLDD